MQNYTKQITANDEGYFLSIAVNEQCAGVQVTGISLYVAQDEDEGAGDLAVTWEVAGLANTGGGDMGSLLMRGADDEVGAVMGAFYRDNAFTARLQEILVQVGFTAEAASDVGGSEWGMQDEGRASYDAYALADEIRASMLATA